MIVARRTRVKICGMTSPDDVARAVEAGADAVGIILAQSPRRVSGTALAAVAAAVPPFVDAVAVLADQDDADAAAARGLGLRLQFSGRESALDCERRSAGRSYLKAFHIAAGTTRLDPADLARFEDYRHAVWMFDTAAGGKLGGTGVAFAWDLIASIARARPIVVSGGLTPENVGRCVRALRPYAVDVRSGVESGGEKDLSKMRAFVRAVREADAEA